MKILSWLLIFCSSTAQLLSRLKAAGHLTQGNNVKERNSSSRFGKRGEDGARLQTEEKCRPREFYNNQPIREELEKSYLKTCASVRCEWLVLRSACHIGNPTCLSVKAVEAALGEYLARWRVNWMYATLLSPAILPFCSIGSERVSYSRSDPKKQCRDALSCYSKVFRRRDFNSAGSYWIFNVGVMNIVVSMNIVGDDSYRDSSKVRF